MEPYFEKNLVINGREINYEGFFNLQDLFNTINKALDDKGYEKREKKTEEKITEEGRNILVELRPYKVKTNYVTLMIKIKIYLHDATEIIKEVNEVKQKYLQGKVKVIFDSWSLTDYESRWGMKPWVYFLKGVINKYLYTFPLESEFTSELASDTAYIYGMINKLFKSYAKPPKKIMKEEEIRKEVGKGIKE